MESKIKVSCSRIHGYLYVFPAKQHELVLSKLQQPDRIFKVKQFDKNDVLRYAVSLEDFDEVSRINATLLEEWHPAVWPKAWPFKPLEETVFPCH